MLLFSDATPGFVPVPCATNDADGEQGRDAYG